MENPPDDPQGRARPLSVHEAIGLAHAQFRAGRLDRAEVVCRKILQALPDQPEALHCLGLVAYHRRRFGEAADLLRRAVELWPNNAGYCSDLGLAMAQGGRFDEAVHWQQRAISLEPDRPEAHSNLADARRAQGRVREAVEGYQAELARHPQNAKAWNNLGLAYAETGRVAEAIDCYRRAVQLAPEGPEAAAMHGNLLTAVLYDPAADTAAIREENQRWADRCAAPLAKEIRPHDNDRTPGRRLRVGYVSPDLRRHVVGWSMLPILAHHDHDRFEVFCYSDHSSPDELTRRLQSHADTWRETWPLSDADLAEQVRRDRIDVLVDLALHTAGNRMLVFARKPAPVQVTYLGYAASTGLPTMDYRITDPYMDPPGEPGDGPEQLLRLPHCYWAYRPAIATPEVGPPPIMRNGFVTFGSFNNYRKVNPAVVAAWSQVLRDVPGSRLLIVLDGGDGNAHVPKAFAEHGVAADRIRLLPSQTMESYFALHNEVDIGLDPFPYNGGITSLNLLWMGVPFVTLAGGRAVGRAGVSLLANVGLTGLIARAVGEYVQIAADLARDRARLAELRGSLRRRLGDSPLMNERQFAADLESLYLDAWERWRGAGG